MASATVQAQEVPLASALDWVPWEQLTPAQRALVPAACCGLYLAPGLQEVDAAPGSLLLEGGNYDADIEGELITVRDGVQIRQDEVLIRSESAVIDRGAELITLRDGVIVRRPGLLLTGARAVVDGAAESSRMDAASYVLHDEHARGTAEVIVYTDADGIVTIDNGVFTRCEPGDNSWAVRGDEIRLDRAEGRGTARDVTLRVRDVPVLYVPWLSFPINDQRASGFLAPVVGTTRDGGLDFSAPYYFNLAPHYDATFTPRLLTDRGLMLGLESRYLGRRSNNRAELNWMPDDDQFDPSTRPLPPGAPDEERWLLDLEHFGRPAPDWTTFLDYEAVSDEDYFQDLGNSGLDVTTQSFLYRTAQLGYVGSNWRLTTSALGYQLIDPSVSEINQPYDRLPRVNLDGYYYAGPNLEYGVSSEYVYFHRDLERRSLTQAQIDAGALVKGQRISVEPEISLPWSSPGAFLRPSAKYRYASYQLENQARGQPHDPSRGVFVGSLDGGLVFERTLEARDGLVQTLEPRLFYLYSGYEDQGDIPVFDSSAMTFSFNQLFREDRFSGQDRVGDTEQLTAALSTRFLDAGGRERASASVGQIFYFRDRRVTLPGQPGQALQTATSSLAGELSYSFSDNWRATSYLEWNSDDGSLDVGSFQFRYQSDINHILNIGYRYRDVPDRIGPGGVDRRINQSDISAVWPLRDDVRLVARWNYDHGNARNLETIGGLEYSSCCWNLRLIARRWIDNHALFLGEVEDNTGIFLQFELKGFGSVLGGNVSGILNNGITGYRDREL